MGDYLAHWINIGAKTSSDKLPKFFYVNWFRKSEDGKWLWPGYGDNSRVIKWIYERVSGEGNAVTTPIGYMPTPEAIDCSGLSIPASNMRELLSVDPREWLNEVKGIKEHYAKFGDRLPAALSAELAALESRLTKAIS